MNNASARLFELIPHRSPMLLLDEVIDVTNNSSSSRVIVSDKSSFFMDQKGVPAWVGVEYMGQTAALIAGYQLENGTVEPHVGFLLGTRKYQANLRWFTPGADLVVSCQELAVVGNSLATFHCEINEAKNGEVLATAKLSVFRKPLEASGSEQKEFM